MAPEIRFRCTHPWCYQLSGSGKTYSFSTMFEHVATHLNRDQKADIMDFVCTCGAQFLTKAFAVSHLSTYNNKEGAHQVFRSERADPKYPITNQQYLLNTCKQFTSVLLKEYVEVAGYGAPEEAPRQYVEERAHNGWIRPEPRRPPNINRDPRLQHQQQYNYIGQEQQQHHRNNVEQDHQQYYRNINVGRPAPVAIEQQQHDPPAAQQPYTPTSPVIFKSPTHSNEGSPEPDFEVNTPCYTPNNSPPRSPCAYANVDSDDDDVPEKKDESKPKFHSDAYSGVSAVSVNSEPMNGIPNPYERVMAEEAKFGNFHRDSAKRNGDSTASNSRDKHNGGPNQYEQSTPVSSRGSAGDAPRFHSDHYGQQNRNSFQQIDNNGHQNFDLQQRQGHITTHFENRNRDNGRGRTGGNDGIPAQVGGKQAEVAQRSAHKFPILESIRRRDSNESQHHRSGDSGHQNDSHRPEARPPQPVPIHPYAIPRPLEIPLPPPPQAHPPRFRPFNQIGANDVPPEKRRRRDEQQDAPRAVPPPKNNPQLSSMGKRPNDSRPAPATDSKGVFMPSTRPLPVRPPDAPRRSTSSISFIIKSQAAVKPGDAAVNDADSTTSDDKKPERLSRPATRAPGTGSWGGGTGTPKVQLVPFTDIKRRTPTPPRRGRSRSRSVSRASSPSNGVGAISDGSRRRGRPPRGSKNDSMGAKAAATTPAKETSQGPRSRATTPAGDRSQGPTTRATRKNASPEPVSSPKNGFNYFADYPKRSKKK